MKAIEGRLAKLEQAAAPTVTLYAWQEDGETTAAAIARQFPEGVPAGARVVVYSWKSDTTKAAPAMPDGSVVPH